MNCLICGQTSLENVDKNPSFTKGQVYRCLSCQVAITHPLPTPKELLEFYQSGYYIKTVTQDKLDKRLSVSQQRALSQFKFIQQYLPQHKGIRKALDLGCSDGSLLLILDQHGFDVWGYEPDSQMAELVNKKLSKGQDRIRNQMFPGDQIEKNTYDLICSSHLFEHIVDPISHLDQIKMSLKTNGYLFMEIPNQYGRLKDFLCPGAKNLGHLYYYSPYSVEHLLKNNGLEVIHLTTCGRNVKTVRKKYGKSSRKIEFENFLLFPFNQFKTIEFIKKISQKIAKNIVRYNQTLLFQKTQEANNNSIKMQSHYTTYWKGDEQGQWIRLLAKKI
ncbi:MAG: class I SAM-dependent methyltransferase [Crocosphaera sp.]|nr:class I SAM-dependent methyltransferase [Crocosphaera sp.]